MEVDALSALIWDGRPLPYRPLPPTLPDLPAMDVALEDDIAEIVAAAPVVDVHTHLLPPSHGALCLWGIDELLTYVGHIRHARWPLVVVLYPARGYDNPKNSHFTRERLFHTIRHI